MGYPNVTNPFDRCKMVLLLSNVIVILKDELPNRRMNKYVSHIIQQLFKESYVKV